MQSLKWLLVLWFVGFGFERLEAQTATPEQIKQALEVLRKTPADPKPAAPQNLAPATPPTAPALAAAPAPANAVGIMNLEQEFKARELLRSILGGVRYSDPAIPTIANGGLKGKAPAVPMPVVEQKVVIPVPTAPQTLATAKEKKAKEDSEREKEIARIEAEVEKAKKLREDKTAKTAVVVPVTPIGQAAVVSPAPATPVTPGAVVAASPAAVTAMTPEMEKKARALLLEAERALSNKPGKVQATPPVVAVVPSAPLTVAPATNPASAQLAVSSNARLTPDMEKKSRELLKADVVVVNSDNPSPQKTTPQPAKLPVATPVPVNPPASIAPPVVADPQPVVAQPATAAMTAEQEMKAREILNQAVAVMKPGQRATPPSLVTPATPAPMVPSVVAAPTPVATTLAAANLTSGQESKARDVLKQKLRELRTGQSAMPLTAPTVAVVTPPIATPSPVTPPPTMTVLVGTAMTPEQEMKARETLKQTVNSMKASQPPSTAPTVAVVSPPPVTPVPPVVAPPVTTPPPVISAVAPPVTATAPAMVVIMTPEQETKAREILAQTRIQINTNKPVAILSAKEQREAKKRAAAEAKAKKEFEKAAAARKTKEQEEARKQATAEVKTRVEAMKAQKFGTTTVAVAPPKTANVKSVGGESKPWPLPESGLSKTKQQRLAELLDAYIKDTVTPAQYHLERAKIISEP